RKHACPGRCHVEGDHRSLVRCRTCEEAKKSEPRVRGGKEAGGSLPCVRTSSCFGRARRAPRATPEAPNPPRAGRARLAVPGQKRRCARRGRKHPSERLEPWPPPPRMPATAPAPGPNAAAGTRKGAADLRAGP